MNEIDLLVRCRAIMGCAVMVVTVITYFISWGTSRHRKKQVELVRHVAEMFIMSVQVCGDTLNKHNDVLNELYALVQMRWLAELVQAYKIAMLHQYGLLCIKGTYYYRTGKDVAAILLQTGAYSMLYAMLVASYANGAKCFDSKKAIPTTFV